MKYIKQLDSIRAIAVLLVMISHWVPLSFLGRFQLGGWGVDIFFVLSGFLITWILLENRQKADNEDIGKGTVIKNFYIRRTLRIFPIYYIVVLLLLLFSQYTSTDIRTSFPYYLTYTSNFYMFGLGKWEGIGILSHLWSLAVEEQFYLFWPTLMLFIPRKYLLHVIYIFIGVGLLSQFLLRNHPMGPIMTPACFQAFGLGALLAWHMVYHQEGLERFYKFISILAVVALIFFIGGLVKPDLGIFKMFRAISSVIGLFLIMHIVYRGRAGKLKFGFVWNNRFLIFMGKISYGIYLYHNIIPHFTSKALDKLGISVGTVLPYKLGYLLMIGVNFVILITISWLSWIIIEKPILALKKHFEYAAKENTPLAVASDKTM
jgi:peptidoglycan/LPS O-acetylase OafA/YrhL